MNQKGQPKHFNVSLPNHNISPYTLGKFIDTFNSNHSTQSDHNPIITFQPRDLEQLIVMDEQEKAWKERETLYPGYYMSDRCTTARS